MQSRGTAPKSADGGLCRTKDKVSVDVYNFGGK